MTSTNFVSWRYAEHFSTSRVVRECDMKARSNTLLCKPPRPVLSVIGGAELRTLLLASLGGALKFYGFIIFVFFTADWQTD